MDGTSKLEITRNSVEQFLFNRIKYNLKENAIKFKKYFMNLSPCSFLISAVVQQNDSWQVIMIRVGELATLLRYISWKTLSESVISSTESEGKKKANINITCFKSVATSRHFLWINKGSEVKSQGLWFKRHSRKRIASLGSSQLCFYFIYYSQEMRTRLTLDCRYLTLKNLQIYQTQHNMYFFNNQTT